MNHTFYQTKYTKPVQGIKVLASNGEDYFVGTTGKVNGYDVVFGDAKANFKYRKYYYWFPIPDFPV